DQFRLANRVMKGVPSRTRERPALPPPIAWIAAGLLAVAIYSLWRLWILRGGTALRHEATLLRDVAEALLKRWELPPTSGEGFEEHTRRIARARPELRGALEPLVQRYLEARFGSQPLERAERVALSGGLKAALLHAGKDRRAA
ncbi:MAG TPA: DUF4129 domain-containing protein, partial [Myxococcaceae bacterium]|nr:DUF4129 domain-containing protein [Myxococcaceae bacterium]